MTSSIGGGSSASMTRVIYNFITAREYKCGGDTAAGKKASGAGAIFSLSTRWHIS